MEGTTLSGKKNFKWEYSKNSGLKIVREFQAGEHIDEFSNQDIDSIINYVNEKQRVPLGNNVEKLGKGIEKEGLGTFVYEYIKSDRAFAQSMSQFVSIMVNIGVFGFNGALKNMEFWIMDSDWRNRIDKSIEL
jgi:3-oxoacyl-ACP reductase-like protein